MNDFSSGAEQLEVAVRRGCAREEQWPARVAAGISAALGFVVANPEIGRTLAIDFRVEDFDRKYLPVIRRFSELLAAEAPPEQRPAASSELALIGGIATVIATHLRSGRLERIEAATPELVYFTLLPYLGFDEAQRWATSQTES